MKTSAASILVAAALVSSLLHSPGAEGASLRQIRRMIERKEYSEARSALSEKMPDLDGRDRVTGMLLPAGIETDMERAVDIYDRVISTGNERERLTAKLEKAKILYSIGEYREVTRILAGVAPRFRCDECFASIYLRGLAWTQLGENSMA